MFSRMRRYENAIGYINHFYPAFSTVGFRQAPGHLWTLVLSSMMKAFDLTIFNILFS